MITVANAWNDQMTEFMGSFTGQLTSAAERYSECTRGRVTGLPALKFFEGKHSVTAETVIPMGTGGFATELTSWNALETCVATLLEMVDKGEDTGVYSSGRLSGYTTLLLYQWLVSARQYLTVSYHWGDMHM